MSGMPVPVLVLLAVGGAVVGSFLNQVIVRMPAAEPLLRPAPACPRCDERIAGRDLVPLVSWLVLRGRCRACGEAIPAGYPLVEAANAVLWVAAGLRFGSGWALIPFLLLFSTLLAQSVIDLELSRLLDRITFPVFAASVVGVVVVSVAQGVPARALLALAGALGYFVLLFVPALVHPRGMGLGDVKLALLMGLFLGWLSPLMIFFALIISSVIGVVVGVGLYLARGRESRQYPFGPWLALGTVVTVLVSPGLLDAYQTSLPGFLR